MRFSFRIRPLSANHFQQHQIWYRALKTPFTRAEKIGTARQILGTGATLHLGPIRLHVENWECRALKSSARCQKFGVPCRFFLARVNGV